MKKIRFLMLPFLFVGSVAGSLYQPSQYKQTILLGSIALPQSLDREIAFPILYKGNEYEAKVEMKGDAKKAHFELHTALQPKTLFILITEYLSLPSGPSIKHLATSTEHPYRLFKLTLQSHDFNQTDSTKKESDALSNWIIEELDNKMQPLEIPDTTIIIFTDPQAVKQLKPISWITESNIMHLPTIVFKEDISQELLQDLAAQMKLALMDFKFLHKKTHCAFVPVANNRIISMPVATGRVRV